MGWLRISANAVTFIRICGTFVLLFLKPFSVAFFAVYTVAGITDVLDGFIARKTGTASDLGARLDSLADIVFYGVMIIKLFKILAETLPLYVWFTAGAALILRICTYIVAAVKYRKFASLHTYLNKLTGLCVFLIPYFFKLPVGTAYCFIVGLVGIAASAEELVIHLINTNYDANKKSVFLKLKSE